MDSQFRVEMLGRFGLRQGDRDITRFRTQKTGSLLACLALHRSRSYPREMLIEMFWPESDLKAARTNLSVALNALRRQLEPPGVPAGAVLIADNMQVRLNPGAFTTDAEAFESAFRQAESEQDTTKRPGLWMTVVDLYHGDLLPGYYEDWILEERDRLRESYATALRHAVTQCAEADERERGIAYARRLVQVDPLDEEAHRSLMHLFIATGRPQDAQRQYQELERLLRDALQTTPSAATQELAASLPPLAPASPRSRGSYPSGSVKQETVVENRLPVSEPRRLQLRLPIQLTRFFGREAEIAQIGEMLHPEVPSPYRLVTLTGPGGTGKTRLSIEVAGRMREAFPGGVWFVPLAELDDPRRLGEALRDALELPRQASSALDQVIAFLNDLSEKHLLILDNFEQIAAGGAGTVWTMLSRVPLLRCLVTSRRPLLLSGEREFPVWPLPTPEDARPLALDALVAYPSIALFVDRAQTVRPDFQVTPRNAGEVAALCEKLEGIPLAIELAAARARTLTTAQMLERLTERFELLASRRADKGERHRSLWAAIDWSYNLLSPEQQQLFAQLSVFRGGWTLEAAEAVMAQALGECPTPNILDGLTSLRGHSLIQATESSEVIRFEMLESLREFAQEQLTPEQRLEMEQHHATYFHQWASCARLFGAERTLWFQKFEEDFDNLRALLAWSLREGNEVGIGLDTASKVGSFWWLRGHISEGRRWYNRLLERVADPGAPYLSRSLQIAGTLAYMQGDFISARSQLERCIEISHTSGDAAVQETAYESLGNVAYREGNYVQARAHYESALVLARDLESSRSLASVLGNLANVAQSTGDFERSRTLNLESLEKWRESGERNGEARTLHNLANLAQSQGQYAEARAFYEQSLTLHRELADRFGVSTALRGLAEIALGRQDYAAAIAHAKESLALTWDMNVRTNLVELLRLFTDLAWNMGEWEAAARTQGTMEQARQEMNYPIPPVDKEEYEQNLATVRDRLGATAYEAVSAEGRKLPLEQALTYLEELLSSRALS